MISVGIKNLTKPDFQIMKRINKKRKTGMATESVKSHNLSINESLNGLSDTFSKDEESMFDKLETLKQEFKKSIKEPPSIIIDVFDNDLVCGF